MLIQISNIQLVFANHRGDGQVLWVAATTGVGQKRENRALKPVALSIAIRYVRALAFMFIMGNTEKTLFAGDPRKWTHYGVTASFKRSRRSSRP